MNKVRLLFSLVIVLFFQGIYAQSISVSGTVTSSDDGAGIPGVTVKVMGKNQGTVTDINGHYQLTAVKGEKLEYRFIGMTTQQREVGDKQRIDMEMFAAVSQLDEVVVSALGIKRQKREVGYTIESIPSAELQLSNAGNLANALSGRSAGVQVINSNGVDGGTTRFVIRGVRNLNDRNHNQPLIVVDGIPMENEPGLTDVGRGVDWGSALNNINSFDIESVDILKGPAASALYGSRGANGVVMITTKRGTRQSGLGVNYNVSYKIAQPYRFREVQNIFGAGGPLSFREPTLEMNEAGELMYPKDIYSDFGPMGEHTATTFGYYGSSVSWGAKMEGQMIRWWDGKMRPWDPQPNNLQMYFKDGATTTHNISFNGGGEMGSMRVSLTNTSHEANIPNSDFKQTTVSLGSNLKISKKLTSDISISYMDYFRHNSPTIGESENSFGKGILYSWPRSYKGIEKEFYAAPNGSMIDYRAQSPFQYIDQNFWWGVNNKNTDLSRKKLIGTVSLVYEITPWLSAMGRFGLDNTNNEFETRNRPIDSLGLEGGYYGHSLARDQVTNAEFLLIAQKEDLFKSGIDAKFSFGGNTWSRDNYGMSANSGKWTQAWVYSVFNAERPEQRGISEARFAKKINSFYALMNLSYHNYAFLELTGRQDWSSTLPSYSNDYFYPSVSFSFLPFEAFDVKTGWLSQFRLRGAYALTAIDTDPYKLDFVYASGNFGGDKTSGLPYTIPPYSLEPQFSSAYEVGSIIGLFDDRIDFNFTYYYINSYNQIMDSPLPVSSGAGRITINTGRVENKGMEIILNTVPVHTSNFTLEAGLNFTRNRNKVISLGEAAEIFEIANIWEGNGPAIAAEPGQDFGTIIGWDYVYHPDNGQPMLNDAGTHYLMTENRVPIGNASPNFLAGFTTRMNWKGFSLSTLIDTKWGGDVYSGTYVTNVQTGQSPSTLDERLGGGLPYTDPDGNVSNSGVILPGVYADGTTNDKVVHYYFKYMPNAGGWGKYLSTPGVFENSWIKMREIALTYSLPPSVMKNLKFIQSLSLNVVGRDLFYIYSSLPDNVNPEGANGSGNAQGLEWGSFPSFRSITFGANVQF